MIGNLSQTPPPKGLSAAEVEERRERGQCNLSATTPTKTTTQIVCEHTLTLFNGINLLLAVIVIGVGEPKNLLFLIVAVSNTVIGIVQELRSKFTVDKLSILTKKQVKTMRDGVECAVKSEDLVIDDVVLLSHGDQVPADAKVLEGELFCDESLLTGESEPVHKEAGDELFSGSIVDSGSGYCVLTKVGKDSYAAGINAQAKYVKKLTSEIMHTLQLIVRIAVFALIPLGLGLFFRTLYLEGSSYREAALTSVAAVIGMVPQGLVLLTSSILAIATIRLAKKSVLISQFYCVETLARVNTLCLDKTGTITTGELEVESLLPVDGIPESELLHELYTISVSHRQDANDTDRAILAYGSSHNAKAREVCTSIPFSSRRKYSGCVCSDGSAYVLGAAEFILSEEAGEAFSELTKGVHAHARVLTVGRANGFDEKGDLTGEVRLSGAVVLKDTIRASAKSTIEQFVRQGVDIKIISGDDPKTVSAIAAEVGVPGAEHAADAQSLTDQKSLKEALDTTVVFGRVTPTQKRDIVRALHEKNRIVAMTGDGINDMLALREADCSVSFASASECARNIAEILLVDNDFSHMVSVVDEGRRSINNLERSASLFLVKSVYTALLALICIIAPPYPFIPVQMSLLSAAVIGIPSFVLALEPNHDLISGHFIVNVLRKSLPASLAIVVGVSCVLMYARSCGLEYSVISTMGMAQVGVVGLALNVKISVPFTPLRRVLLLGIVLLLVLPAVLFSSLFEISFPTGISALVAFAICAASLAVFCLLYSCAATLKPSP